MSIAGVITRGFGTFGSVNEVVVAGFLGTAPPLGYDVQPVALPAANSVRARFTPAGTDPIDYGVAVLTDGAAIPTAADVLAGTVPGAIASLTGQTAASNVQETSVPLTGLTELTAFDLYVSIDDSVTLPLLSNRVDFTTFAEAGMTEPLTSDLTSDLTGEITT